MNRMQWQLKGRCDILPEVQDEGNINAGGATLVEKTKGGRGKQGERPRDECFQGTASTWLCDEHGITGEER